MRKAKSRFLIVILIIILLIASVAPAVSARWSYISYINNSIIVSGGTATMKVTVTADSSITKTVISAVLEKQNGSSWDYVTTYSATNLDSYAYQSWSRSNCMGSYRLVTTVSVYVGSTLKESVTVTSYS